MSQPSQTTRTASMRTLHRGDRGGDVKLLQQFLAGKGYTIIADGDFGSLTESAVRDYQTKHALTSDGWVGRQTWLSLLGQGIDVLIDRSEHAAWPPVPDSITPITTNRDRQNIFGTFKFRPAPEPGNPEAIEILDDWPEHNIVRVVIPALAHVHPGPIPLHRAVVDDFQAFFAEVAAAGLIDHIRSFDGSWCPRYIRGSRTTLSAHAWGSAIDLNADTNGLGCTPAPRGTMDSLRELAAIAPKHRLYWGGWFSSRPDGMHFEHTGR